MPALKNKIKLNRLKITNDEYALGLTPQPCGWLDEQQEAESVHCKQVKEKEPYDISPDNLHRRSLDIRRRQRRLIYGFW